jgi:hypothetical protein
LQLSRIELATYAANCTVNFDAVNHGQKPIAKTLRVTVFFVRPGTKFSPPVDVQLDHRDIPIVLGSFEGRRIQCEFPLTGTTVPNHAEAEILGE